MANLLILNHDIPYPQDFNGNAARVLPLSRALANEHDCWLGTFTRDEVRQAGILGTGIFRSCTNLPSVIEALAPTRYAFLRTGHLASRRTPQHYRSTVSCIAELVEEQHIDAIIAHGLRVSEFALGVKVKARIFDSIDCITLTSQRRFIVDRHDFGISSYIRAKLGIFRAAHQERYCMRKFDITSLASPVDVEFMQSLCKDTADRVKLIPNGVASTFLNRKGCPCRSEEKAIAFWGALDFYPNTTSIRWFFHHVYRPFLQKRGIRWYIIGKGAPDDIKRYSNEDPNVIVTGFIDDLPSFLTRIPIMVNPMRAGSGIKNKVLEAFAMERAVVSNRMGIESLAAKPDLHYAPAETPEEFCDQIESLLLDKVRRDSLGSRARQLVDELYDWGSIGRSYRKIVEEVLNRKHPEGFR